MLEGFLEAALPERGLEPPRFVTAGAAVVLVDDDDEWGMDVSEEEEEEEEEAVENPPQTPSEKNEGGTLSFSPSQYLNSYHTELLLVFPQWYKVALLGAVRHLSSLRFS